VNGLRVGAPVKFRGVDIGTVDAILLSLSGLDIQRKNPSPNVKIPVVIDIDSKKIESRGAEDDLSDPAVMRHAIALGLRGTLNMQSFVTGVLYIDLDIINQGKKGVVVDVRNNNGGYVNGRVIDVFARKNYLLMTPRDGSTTPSRQALGQRALGLPTVLVTNESTLSDGEDFTEGYRTLQLGKVVGTPTAGWIIFTGAQRLIDGSSVRTPGERIQTLEGKDMEWHPRPVDVEITRPLGETETGEDAQLKKAVETLLGQLK